MAWKLKERHQAEGACGPGYWLYDEASKRTIFDTGALDAFPIGSLDRAKIEALPELLAACEASLLECTDSVCRAMGPRYSQWVRKLQDAIAKAKGGDA